jgi:16S rRNA (uracil1498-N3)-methyltransferase
MALRLYLAQPLVSGQDMQLPPALSRHVQVLRLQPGEAVILFNGQGGQWTAEITQMSRQSVWVRLGTHSTIERELKCAVTLALGVPANDRMDTVIEKASELGVASIQPLMCERSVLRLEGERALKKQSHWQGVAAAASEQCGRTRVADINTVCNLRQWLDMQTSTTLPHQKRWLLSPSAQDQWQPQQAAGASNVLFLSGPEGGLSADEENLAQEHGFIAIHLGPRVLRADTAPLAVLAALALSC